MFSVGWVVIEEILVILGAQFHPNKAKLPVDIYKTQLLSNYWASKPIDQTSIWLIFHPYLFQTIIMSKMERETFRPSCIFCSSQASSETPGESASRIVSSDAPAPTWC